MNEPTLVAAVQMSSRDDLDANLARAAELTRRAAARGATLIGLPENLSFIGPEEAKLATAETFELGAVSEQSGRVARWGSALARETRAWLLLGGVPERTAEAGRVHNTALLLDPAGAIVARYRKVHLFDVALADGTAHNESRVVAPGGDVVVADTPAGRLGLSICYDVRFPELYRRLVTAGATVLAVPAAFTVPTGRDHWHVLLRARAIESQCYVLAPAQWGKHPGNRLTYGKSLVADPWGDVVAQASDGVNVARATLDPKRVGDVRGQLPSLRHRRL